MFTKCLILFWIAALAITGVSRTAVAQTNGALIGAAPKPRPQTRVSPPSSAVVPLIIASSQSQRERTREVQIALAEFGFDPGVPDGIMGKRTRKAISDFFAFAKARLPDSPAEQSLWFLEAARSGKSAEGAAAYLRGVARGFALAGGYNSRGKATTGGKRKPVAANKSSNRRPPVSNSMSDLIAGAVIGGVVSGDTTRPKSSKRSSGSPTVQVAMARPTGAAVPTRQFAGPTMYPPEGYRGYGVIAFKSLATEFDRLRHNIICEAYMAALLPDGQAKSRNVDKFVTIWPVTTDAEAQKLNGRSHSKNGSQCVAAIDNYNALLADSAIRAARKTGFKDTGRGPFFLGWLPSAGYGQKDALIIVMDMSQVQTFSQAEALINEWKLDIQTDENLLKSPLSPEMIRRKIRRWSDRHGVGFLTFIKGN